MVLYAGDHFTAVSGNNVLFNRHCQLVIIKVNISVFPGLCMELRSVLLFLWKRNILVNTACLGYYTYCIPGWKDTRLNMIFVNEGVPVGRNKG